MQFRRCANGKSAVSRWSMLSNWSGLSRLTTFSRHQRNCFANTWNGRFRPSMAARLRTLHNSTEPGTEAVMSRDERDMLDLLRTELDFIEKGGYGRDVRTPWRERSIFRDSLSCVNYALPEKTHPCDECHLIDFVPEAKRHEVVPCHSIPLTDAGDTIETLEGNQSQLEEVLKHWLRKKIQEMEAARTEGNGRF